MEGLTSTRWAKEKSDAPEDREVGPSSPPHTPPRTPSQHLRLILLEELQLSRSSGHSLPVSSDVVHPIPESAQSDYQEPRLIAFQVPESSEATNDSDAAGLPIAPPTTVVVSRTTNPKLGTRGLKFDLLSDHVFRRFLREPDITLVHRDVPPSDHTKISRPIYAVSLLAFVQSRIKLIQQGVDLSGGSVSSVYTNFTETRTIRDIAAGLEHLHSIDIVHGDVKADNILMSDSGRALLYDLGLTDALDRSTRSMELKSTGSIRWQGPKLLNDSPGWKTSTAMRGVGSLRWESPELLDDSPKSSPSDVYAFAMAVVEILTGDHPFPHLKTQASVLRAIAVHNQRPAFHPPSRLGVDFQPLWKLAAECWKTEAGNRPPMKEVLRRLELMEPRLVAPPVEVSDSASPGVQVVPADSVGLVNAIPVRDEAPGLATSLPSEPHDKPQDLHTERLALDRDYPAVLHQSETNAPRAFETIQSTTISEASTTDDTESLSSIESVPSSAALDSNRQIKLWLSDQDFHLLDFPDAPPVAGGGYCDLYMATHRPTGVQLAMKCLRVFPGKDTLRRFCREAKMWSEFVHINILPFFGTMNINHKIYLTSAWMPLGDLLTFVQARIGFIKQYGGVVHELIPPVYSTFNEIRTIREIAAGLEYLHSRGAIHGDMKGRNVLLDNEGRVQICDFGLTKTLDHTVTSVDQQGAGSPRWQSPELFESVPKTRESDMYAFGMTIVEVLTGDYPFPNIKSPSAVMKVVVVNDQRPVPEPTQRHDVDFRPLWNLAAECWRREPEDRPSMRAVLRYLDELELSTLDHQNETAVLQHYEMALQQLRTSSRSELEHQSADTQLPQLPEASPYWELEPVTPESPE